MFSSAISYSQLKVQNGTLKISDYSLSSGSTFIYIDKMNKTSSTQYGIYSRIRQRNSAPNGDCIGVYGFAETQNSGEYPARYIGVLGSSYNASNYGKYGIGVVGLAGTKGGHIGIYGGISSLPSSLPNTIYAGYFSGQVHVTSQISATAFVVSSDARVKKNIEPIDQHTLNNLLRLNPVIYDLKQIEGIDTLRNQQNRDSSRYSQKI